jgi:16S rRNA (cytidine1402-2'-O)-methyltransferase
VVEAVSGTVSEPLSGSQSGALVLCGSPIGNSGDASPRLREALETADIVAAEDTRRLRRLASDLGIKVSGELFSYYEGNERGRVPQLVERMLGGSVVALITDAGMPAISDPGFRLVRAAAQAGVPVRVVPGPSAVTTALALSGLPSDRWVFEGFLPRGGGERRSRLAQLATEPRTIVLLESPRRTERLLGELAEGFGADRAAALCRELTKTYEEVLRLPLGELMTWAAEREVRGEITLVIAGAPEAPPPSATDLAASVLAREAAGVDRKVAMGEVARAAGIPRRDVYDAVLAARALAGPVDKSK